MFRPDEGFGSIRQHVDARTKLLSVQEMKVAIEASSESNRCVLFPVEDVRNWKKVSETFTLLTDFRKYFAYKIHIKALQESNERKVVVDVYLKPDGDVPDISTSLLKPGKQYPVFESLERIPVKKLTKARRASLLTDMFLVLERNRMHMSHEARSWWNEIGIAG